MEIIIFAVIALGIGYLIIRNFNKIDTRLFGATATNYNPFGLTFVFLSAFLGAIIGISLFREVDENEIMQMAISCFAIITALSFYYSMARMESWKARFGKFLFLDIACAIGVLTGALGSIAIIIAITIYLLIIIFSMMLGGNISLKKNEVKLEDGTVLKVKKGLFGDQSGTDSEGGNWEHSGDRWAKNN